VGAGGDIRPGSRGGRQGAGAGRGIPRGAGGCVATTGRRGAGLRTAPLRGIRSAPGVARRTAPRSAGAGSSAALHDSGRRRATVVTTGGPGAGRDALPGGPAGLCGSPPRGNRNAPGGWPSLRSGAGEGRLRTRLQRPLRTGIRNAPRGFASHRFAGFGIRGGGELGAIYRGAKLRASLRRLYGPIDGCWIACVYHAYLDPP